ncbi:hypothetical protein ABTN21_19040, partial [Acinetobacter baumannii]
QSRFGLHRGWTGHPYACRSDSGETVASAHQLEFLQLDHREHLQLLCGHPDRLRPQRVAYHWTPYAPLRI